jgi:putative toxin-antitoxin system antitoxin component (TIGR02293 family)
MSEFSPHPPGPGSFGFAEVQAHLFPAPPLADPSGREIAAAWLGGEAAGSPLALDAWLRQGLERSWVNAFFQGFSRLPRDQAFEEAIGLSGRSLQRYRESPAGRLNLEQSGRIWNFARILAKATQVFGSRAAAETWLDTPAMGLEGRRPIVWLATPEGLSLVEIFLDRLESGTYT